MRLKKVDRPIFFIGAPRSGTTLMYEAFSRHPQLSWLMNYNNLFPHSTLINLLIPLLNNKFFSLVGKKDQYKQYNYFDKFKPRPDECYNFWAEHTPEIDFSRDFLIDMKATEDTQINLRNTIYKLNKYQNKERFSTKLTGPGRIEYLNSIFPDAIFIHIIRDGRSVVQSLMKVPFWKTKVHEPWFKGGLTQCELEKWRKSNKNPIILTTLLWNKIIELTQAEALDLNLVGDRYIEIRYEDFIIDPNSELKKIFEFSKLLSDDRIVSSCLTGTDIIGNMNKKFTSQFSDKMQEEINVILEPNLKKLGYIDRFFK